MKLLEEYLFSLNESIRNYSQNEIERTHHLFAVDNMISLYNNGHLSQVIFKIQLFERKYGYNFGLIKRQRRMKSMRSFESIRIQLMILKLTLT
jgi:hypothetical protein